MIVVAPTWDRETRCPDILRLLVDSWALLDLLSQGLVHHLANMAVEAQVLRYMGLSE